MGSLDLPIGPLLTPKSLSKPPPIPLHGAYTSLIPLSPSHAPSIHKHLCGAEHDQIWTYLSVPPPPDLAATRSAIDSWIADPTLQFYAILSGPESNSTSEAVGMIAYLNIVPEHRRLEIGWVVFSAVLKQTRKATETFKLLMEYALGECGYERVEWKANSFNKASRRAAERLGFLYEGIFRKHICVKGRRRDTAWYAVIDEDWPVVKKGFESWLSEDNFDEEGRQKKGLKEIREAVA